jgi:hypothetical protein
MCLLQYHTKELTYLLEYYRAGEIYDIVQNLKFVEREDIRQAGTLLRKRLNSLNIPRPCSKTWQMPIMPAGNYTWFRLTGSLGTCGTGLFACLRLGTKKSIFVSRG